MWGICNQKKHSQQCKQENRCDDYVIGGDTVDNVSKWVYVHKYSAYIIRKSEVSNVSRKVGIKK